MGNNFSQLDKQSETCDFATMTPSEQAEYSQWVDEFVLGVAQDLEPEDENFFTTGNGWANWFEDNTR